MKRKNLIVKILMVVLLVLIFISIVFPISKTITTNYSGNEIIGELKAGDVIEEEFISNGNYNKVGIPFANYGKINDKGYFKVAITNSKNKQKKYKIKLGNIVDNEDYYLKYKLKKNQKYKIYMKLYKPKYPITIYLTNKDKKANTIFNGNKLKNNIRLSFMYSIKDYFNIWNYSFIFLLIILYAILIKNSGEENEKK